MNAIKLLVLEWSRRESNILEISGVVNYKEKAYFRYLIRHKTRRHYDMFVRNIYSKHVEACFENN